MNFDQAKKYIPNLKRRPDRKRQMIQQFNRLGITNYEFYEAIDGKKEKLSKGEIKSTQIACLLSHLNIIKKSKEDNLEYVVIIEDDADFCSQFNLMLSNVSKQIPKDWDMLYFGAHNFRKLRMVSSNIGRCVTSLSTICYAVNNTAYDTIINTLEKAENILDLYYVNEIHPNINAYCFYPNLVTQQRGFSDIEEMNVDYHKYYNKW